MDYGLLGEVAFGLVLGGLVLWATRVLARSDFELGRQAFRDGLHYNPAWNDEVRNGWREERSQAELRKLREIPPDHTPFGPLK